MFDPDDDDFMPSKRQRVPARTPSHGKRRCRRRKLEDSKSNQCHTLSTLIIKRKQSDFTSTDSGKQTERRNEKSLQLICAAGSTTSSPIASSSERRISVKRDCDDIVDVVSASTLCDVPMSHCLLQSDVDDKFVLTSTAVTNCSSTNPDRADDGSKDLEKDDVQQELLSNGCLGSESATSERMDIKDSEEAGSTNVCQTASNRRNTSFVQTSILSFLDSQKHNTRSSSRTSDIAESDRNDKTMPYSMKKCQSNATQMLVECRYDGTFSGAAKAQRTCPFYKRVPGTNFTVDAFSYGVIPGCTAYFLSHFHYDHYGGLKQEFRQPIYCSSPTANLVRTRLHVSSHYIHPLPLNTLLTIEGITVCLLDANHCPGSVMFLFGLPNGRRHLHTGDIRATPQMEHCDLLTNSHIDQLFLDTTYMDPYYCFPAQSDVIQFAVNIAQAAVVRNKKTLIVCGSYTIGKERIFVAIAQALHCFVGVTREKLNILQCLEDDELMSLVTEDLYDSQVHVLPMNSLSHVRLKLHLDKFSNHFSSLVAFKPTGWTYSKKATSLHSIKPSVRGSVSIYGIPYSEHSSFEELRQFVQFLKPSRIVPTVGVGSANRRQEMQRILSSWLHC